MTLDTLEKKIANRANERVQNRIATCRAAIVKALDDLGVVHEGYRLTVYSDSLRLAAARDVLAAMMTESKEWPRYLWADEENRVREEIMGIIDPLQRVLLARDPLPDEPRGGANDIG